MDFPTEGLPLPSCSSSSQTQLSTLSGMVPYWAGATSWCSGIAVPLLSSHLNTRKSNHHWFKKKKKKVLSAQDANGTGPLFLRVHFMGLTLLKQRTGQGG